MKRFEVVVNRFWLPCFLCCGLPELEAWVLGQYRWRWLASVQAFLFNSGPITMGGMMWVSCASVRPVLRVIDGGRRAT